MDNTYDVLIVGAGPIGIATALEAKKRGWSYLVIEKGTLTNSLYNYPKEMQFFSSSDNLSLDNIPFVCKEPKPFRSEALQYYRAVAQTRKLTLNLFEKVLSIEKNDEGKFHVITSKDRYTSRHVVLATGFYDIPNRLDIPGEDMPHVFHYFEEAHFFANQRVCVVGANNSAVDAALSCYRAGAKVEMIIRGEEIGERVKYWVRPEIINRIEDQSIKAHYRSELTRIESKCVYIKQDDQTLPMMADFVLLMTGYRPDFDFLSQCGVTFENNSMRAPKVNEKTLETECEHLYLAGVVLGGLKTNAYFIDNSREHAQQIGDAIAAKFNS